MEAWKDGAAGGRRARLADAGEVGAVVLGVEALEVRVQLLHVDRARERVGDLRRLLGGVCGHLHPQHTLPQPPESSYGLAEGVGIPIDWACLRRLTGESDAQQLNHQLSRQPVLLRTPIALWRPQRP